MTSPTRGWWLELDDSPVAAGRADERPQRDSDHRACDEPVAAVLAMARLGRDEAGEHAGNQPEPGAFERAFSVAARVAPGDLADRVDWHFDGLSGRLVAVPREFRLP